MSMTKLDLDFFYYNQKHVFLFDIKIVYVIKLNSNQNRLL
jgi:hypothetical protein